MTDQLSTFEKPLKIPRKFEFQLEEKHSGGNDKLFFLRQTIIYSVLSFLFKIQQGQKQYYGREKCPLFQRKLIYDIQISRTKILE